MIPKHVSVPDGAQVDLVGAEGVDHVIRYQDRELIVLHDTILWEQPPQRVSLFKGLKRSRFSSLR
jgi:hypothetical protein